MCLLSTIEKYNKNINPDDKYKQTVYKDDQNANEERDENGTEMRLIESSDAKGTKTMLSYDKLGRQTEKTTPAINYKETYEYVDVFDSNSSKVITTTEGDDKRSRYK